MTKYQNIIENFKVAKHNGALTLELPQNVWVDFMEKSEKFLIQSLEQVERETYQKAKIKSQRKQKAFDEMKVAANKYKTELRFLRKEIWKYKKAEGSKEKNEEVKT